MFSANAMIGFVIGFLLSAVMCMAFMPITVCK